MLFSSITRLEKTLLRNRNLWPCVADCNWTPERAGRVTGSKPMLGVQNHAKLSKFHVKLSMARWLVPEKWHLWLPCLYLETSIFKDKPDYINVGETPPGPQLVTPSTGFGFTLILQR
eukprot:Gb_12408 [translate_table: standard]